MFSFHLSQDIFKFALWFLLWSLGWLCCFISTILWIFQFAFSFFFFTDFLLHLTVVRDALYNVCLLGHGCLWGRLLFILPQSLISTQEFVSKLGIPLDSFLYHSNTSASPVCYSHLSPFLLIHCDPLPRPLPRTLSFISCIELTTIWIVLFVYMLALYYLSPLKAGVILFRAITAVTKTESGTQIINKEFLSEF